MRRLIWTTSLTLTVFGAVGAAAAPADSVRARIAGYRALGDAYKTVNDAIRAGDLRTPRLQQASSVVLGSSRLQYRWFPAASGPQSRARTAARAEIWARPSEFRAAQDGFARQAAVFDRAVRGGDAATIRREARKLGAQCKACHDAFRASDD